LTGSPGNPSSALPSLQEIANTSFSRTYSQRQAGAPQVINATDLAPFILSLGTVTKIRMLFVRVVGSGVIRLKLTSAAGADQALPLSDLIVWHAPAEGDQITAVKVVGTADLEYTVYGD
jgi:hypothetical protein